MIGQSCADSHEENGLILKMKVECINFKGINGFVCFCIPVDILKFQNVFATASQVLPPHFKQNSVFSKQKMDICILIIICPIFSAY